MPKRSISMFRIIILNCAGVAPAAIEQPIRSLDLEIGDAIGSLDERKRAHAATADMLGIVRARAAANRVHDGFTGSERSSRPNGHDLESRVFDCRLREGRARKRDQENRTPAHIDRRIAERPVQHKARTRFQRDSRSSRFRECANV